MGIPKLPSITYRHEKSVVSDEMIEFYFEGTNFGGDKSTKNRRKLLANGLLKHQAGWHNGHTMQQLLISHLLVNKRGYINKRGRMFLWEFFSNSNV